MMMIEVVMMMMMMMMMMTRPRELLAQNSLERLIRLRTVRGFLNRKQAGELETFAQHQLETMIWRQI